MKTSRRDIIKITGTTLATSLLAGCNTTKTNQNQNQNTRQITQSPNIAVASEWNSIRARIWDTLSLVLAEKNQQANKTAQKIFERFESANGEYGSHEMLEKTNQSNYEKFEEALGELRTQEIQTGNTNRVKEKAMLASSQLSEAQKELTNENIANILDLQLLGVTIQNAAFLALSQSFHAVQKIAENVLNSYEEAPASNFLESTNTDLYRQFKKSINSVISAAENKNAETVKTKASVAFQVAIDSSYAIANTEVAAGAGHIATLQSRGWDAALLPSLGGPTISFSHAVTLTIYRARTYDSQLLASRGETNRAAQMASDIFAHFEGARVHSALEEANTGVYERFESGLSDLQSAIKNENSSGITKAVNKIDSNLVDGISSLAKGNTPILQAAFFKIRFADTLELYRLGYNNIAASIAKGLFQRFERNELNFHETVESLSEEIYNRFEGEHLSGFIDALNNQHDSSVESHYQGLTSTLLEFETMYGSTDTVSGAEGAYIAGLGFDSAVLDYLGFDSRAQEIVQKALQYFESGAGGYHEALEKVDESIYKSFETQLGEISNTASNGEEVYPVVKQFNSEVLNSIYSITESGAGSYIEDSVGIMQDVFSHFEEARVHKMLEEADHNAYTTFEERLDAYISALQEGRNIDRAVKLFAYGSLYAQFALVDSVEELPIDLDLAGVSGSSSSQNGNDGETDLQGGPNVVEDIPEDADHVIDMNAISYSPKELTVSKGDKVAWIHAAGEPHTVTAYGENIPEEANYWASGDFNSEEKARTGWKNGKGAIQSGQSYIHTFETKGTHKYFCIPHEPAGMEGKITVE